MKRAALLLALFGVTGCGDSTGPLGDSHLSGRWAGAAWVGNAQALVVSGTTGADTLYLFGLRRTSRPDPEEVVRVRVPFTGPGAYELAGDAVEYAIIVGGDVVAGEYAGQSPAAGTLTVAAYDPTSGAMRGSVQFDAVAASEIRPYGPAARFEDGRFQVTRVQRQ
jgi:hypothetical protein